ncbi:MAG: 3'(2'),5'-bisphosphate nucleotidase CysQ [Alphaproteobacteria bacterium]|nr:3'(2'),5'-bisphosphate nucleotidase CysQ [Alphaproteobacteria bacterium]
MNYSELIEALRPIVQKAGRETVRIYEKKDYVVRKKEDLSPVTEADEISERILVDALHALTPDIPVVSEERAEIGDIPSIEGGKFWLVDPLDGTKEFIGETGEFTINVALVINGRPVLGLIGVPLKETIYAAAGPGTATIAVGEEAPNPITAVRASPEGFVVVSSRSHAGPKTEAYLTTLKVRERRISGSAVKFCVIAAGDADLYPRFGRTMEWDTAAGHAILLAAGGNITTLDGEELRYGKPDFVNPAFVARGRV